MPRYLVAVIAVLLAFLIREALERRYGELPHYILFYPVVLLVAMLSGLWAGVWATAVAALVTDYWVLPPKGQFTITRTSDAIGLAIFCAMGVCVSVVAELYHRNRRRLAAYEKSEAVWEERRKAEEALRESGERFRALVTTSSDVVYRMSADWREMRHLVGKDFIPDAEAPSGTWVEKYIPVDDQPLVWATINEAIRTKSIFELEHRVLRVDGNVGWTFSRAIPLLDTNGEIIEWFGAASDVTDRKQAEEALRASEERWSTTLRSIGDAVISTNANGRIMFMNEVAEKLTGWSLTEAQGRDLEEVFNIVNEVTRIKLENPVTKVIQIGQVVGLANHTALISRDGTELPIEDSGAPIRDKDGQITGVVLVFHDIIEKRRAEKAVRDSERLALTGRMASTLAHEIHNPLDTVGALLYLINQVPNAPEPVRQHASLAGEELARVTQMTRHMLSFQREAKNPVPIKIGEILDNVLALYERKIESAGIRVEKQVDFEGEFIGLPGEMRQVFANLIGNAIEAIGKNGKIRLHAYASRDWRQGRRGLRVTVADNGPGIPADVRDKIFDPFFTTKGEGGTGLGLWIISGIIENNDGLLRLRTVARGGRSGTCFSVFFAFPAQ
ncbi:MAG: PAS domain S-box protein [Candidatus Korobacteraceae bacterium]